MDSIHDPMWGYILQVQQKLWYHFKGAPLFEQDFTGNMGFVLVPICHQQELCPAGQHHMRAWHFVRTTGAGKPGCRRAAGAAILSFEHANLQGCTSQAGAVCNEYWLHPAVEETQLQTSSSKLGSAC